MGNKNRQHKQQKSEKKPAVKITKAKVVTEEETKPSPLKEPTRLSDAETPKFSTMHSNQQSAGYIGGITGRSTLLQTNEFLDPFADSIAKSFMASQVCAD